MADTDGNGSIDYQEFKDLVIKLDENKRIDEKEIKNQFENHDT
jgi:hypothetical protein